METALDVDTGDYTLRGLSRISVILGKNGCGKSTLLKRLSAHARSSASPWTRAKYVTPERGGTLVYDPNMENNLRSSPGWLFQMTESNQFAQYKQQTVTQFDGLQLQVLQAVEESAMASVQPTTFFRDYVDRINALLDNIEIKSARGERGFKIFRRTNGAEIAPANISSGESELISLAIECLAFGLGGADGGSSCLILDEPDVHLHPDLQARFMRFLNALVSENPGLVVIMATHSTAILGELSRYAATTVSPMTAGQTSLDFEPIDEAYRRVLPVFGAHPLTSIFRESPILLVEGTDEDRIWQQAGRSSEGKISFYPIDTGGVDSMSEYEDRVLKITAAVYDGAVAYSLRDRDGGVESIDDRPPLVRMRLSCRASENLILTDEVLGRAGTDWLEVSAKIATWVTSNPNHSKAAVMQQFVASGLDRRAFDLKDVRMILVADILQSNRPWEVIVGQAIGKMSPEALSNTSEGSLAAFLGEKVVQVIRPMLLPHGYMEGTQRLDFSP